jgi:Multicopper oxidase
MFQSTRFKNGTVLLNGKGDITRFGCPSGPNDVVRCENSTLIPPIETLRFDGRPVPGSSPPRRKRYLLRVINISFEAQFVFSIDNHVLSVASADFVPIHPYPTHSILVGIGQRYNVIVEANPTGPNSDLQDFWIRTGVANCFGLNPKFLIDGYDQSGILTYRKGAPETPSSTRWEDISYSECSDEPAKSLVPIVPWVVGPAANGIPVGGTGEERDVYEDLNGLPTPNGTYPLAFFSLERPEHDTFNPLRVDYESPMFFHLNESLSTMWPAPWVVIPENFNETDWVCIMLAYFSVDANSLRSICSSKETTARWAKLDLTL